MESGKRMVRQKLELGLQLAKTQDLICLADGKIEVTSNDILGSDVKISTGISHSISSKSA